MGRGAEITSQTQSGFSCYAPFASDNIIDTPYRNLNILSNSLLSKVHRSDVLLKQNSSWMKWCYFLRNHD